MRDTPAWVFWNHPAARVVVQVLDTRVQQLKIEGQELMTRDKVTLRLTLTAEYDPKGRHDRRTAMKFFPSVLDWLEPRLAKYKSP